VRAGDGSVSMSVWAISGDTDRWKVDAAWVVIASLATSDGVHLRDTATPAWLCWLIDVRLVAPC
jgi:hypothetical protein